MTQVVRAFIGIGLVLGAVQPAAAQSMALPASDPVGIGRSGAQVAYGYSLEAASTNPALMSSLKEKVGAYASIGLEMMATQQSLEAQQNQESILKTRFSADRNRVLPAFGLAVRVSPALSLGLKLDAPFMRHSRLPDDSPSRYLGDSLGLTARRMEGQAAWAFSPGLSVGFGVGVARLSFASSSVMRFDIPNDPTSPISSSNAVNGLVEQRVGQQGTKVVPSYSLGLRWAIHPRWTLGFTHQSGLKGDLSLKSEQQSSSLGLFDNEGLGGGPVGAASRAATLLALTQTSPGNSTLELPSQTTIGVRHRILPIMTWEADLRWTSASLRMPAFATARTPSGTVSTPAELPRGRGHLALSASTELDLGKFWVLRAGLSLDQRSVEEAQTEPLMGGARTAAFSFGAGYKIWGGELDFGYQYRQSEDQDTRRLTGDWSDSGFHATPVNRVRMEGMGHLVALGYRMSF
jgi:long-subunit fatty acid transport protein